MTKIDVTKVNGIRLVNIHNKSNISFIGIGISNGSNYEAKGIEGIAHFAEHLFFKGTKTKSWRTLNEKFALLGIEQNAYTDNREVLYHCTVPNIHVMPAWDLMLDMFFNSTFDPEEMEKERNVILEEKKGYDDCPASAFYEAIGSNLFAWDKGHSTIGTKDTIKSISRDQIIKYMDDTCNTSNVTFVCCGNTNTQDLVKHIESKVPKNHRYLQDGNINQCSDQLWNEKFLKKCNKKIVFKYKRKEIQQASVSLPMQVFSPHCKQWQAQRVLMTYFEGGMFSRLFSIIREELGLCYSVSIRNIDINYPHQIIYDLHGAVSPKNINKFIEECEKEFFNTIKNGLNKKTFECAKISLINYVIRHTETSERLAMSLMNQILFSDEITTPETSMSLIEKVKAKDCLKVAEQILTQPLRWCVMIPE
jgi:predicted Zn-dependent peptidase